MMFLTCRTKSKAKVDPRVVSEIRQMVDKYNRHAEKFRLDAERFKQDDGSDVKLKLIGRRSRDGRMYNLPTSNEVACLLVGKMLSALEFKLYYLFTIIFIY